MDLNLKDKIVIVTGGAKGIGKAIVEAFAAEGAVVYFTYFHSEKEALLLENKLLAGNNKVQALSCDVKDSMNIKHLCDEIGRENGRVDVLVNNSGITKDGLLMRMSEENWSEVLNTNTGSVFHFTKSVLPFMLKSGGAVVNISSVVGITGNSGQANYAASKAAIIAFSKSVAKEYGSRDIRCNVIAPGYVQTDMVAALKPDQTDAARKMIPLGRFAGTDEIAAVVLFLSSEKSSYITGQVIPVCGGLL